MTGGAPAAAPATAASRARLPKALALLSAALDRIVWLAQWAIVLIVAGMVVVVASQFYDRYVSPLWGGIPAEEYVKVGIIWLTFLGFGVALRAGVSVRVDLIDSVLAVRVRRWLYAAFDVLLLFVLGVVLYKGVRLYDIATGQLILGTDMTVAVPTLGMLLGLVVTALAIVERVFLRFYAAESA
jgi:TRAP-type transport system small permease protein